MEEWWTHVAAVLIGVLVTAYFLAGRGGGNKAEESKEVNVVSAVAGDSKSAGGVKKKNKKNKNTKGGATASNGERGGGAAVAAESSNDPPVAETVSETKKEEEQPSAAAKKDETNNKPIKKKKKKNKSGATTAAAAAVKPAATAGETEPTKKVVEKPKAAAAAPAPAPAEEDGWSTIPSSKKKKTKKVTNGATKKPSGGSSGLSETVKIDAKKVGIIIGPKGATMQAIQDATDTKLDVNAPKKEDANKPNATASVVITGTDPGGIQKAKLAVQELATKGIARLLQTDKTFGEHYITVHPRNLSEIVGPNGRNIQALQTALNIKISIPRTDWKPNMPATGKQGGPSCKVGISGPAENCKAAKKTLQQLIDYHYTPITHPGCTHEEVYVPSEFFHAVIGPRGSQIKHIKGNYKVEVYMPNDESMTENVVVVGKQGAVDKAIGYINLLMERDAGSRERKYNDEYY